MCWIYSVSIIQLPILQSVWSYNTQVQQLFYLWIYLIHLLFHNLLLPSTVIYFSINSKSGSWPQKYLWTKYWVDRVCLLGQGLMILTYLPTIDWPAWLAGKNTPKFHHAQREGKSWWQNCREESYGLLEVLLSLLY